MGYLKETQKSNIQFSNPDEVQYLIIDFNVVTAPLTKNGRVLYLRKYGAVKMFATFATTQKL